MSAPEVSARPPTDALVKALGVAVASAAVALIVLEVIQYLINRKAMKEGPKVVRESAEYLAVYDATVNYLDTLKARLENRRTA